MSAHPSCAVDRVLRIIGDRWTLGIIHELSLGPRRTLELHREFKGLSTKTLLARLRKLERGGLVSRRSFRESPPRVEYSLTIKGQGLLPVVKEMGKSALLWNDQAGDDLVCTACAALQDSEHARALGQPSEGSGPPPTTSAGAASKRMLNRKRRDVTLL